MQPKTKQLPHAVCGAKTRNGTPCQTKPMANGRCRMHGGLSDGSGRLKHGRYRKVVRETLGDLLLKNRLETMIKAMKLLEPYLDDTTKEGLEQAIIKFEATSKPFKALESKSYSIEVLKHELDSNGS